MLGQHAHDSLPACFPFSPQILTGSMVAKLVQDFSKSLLVLRWWRWGDIPSIGWPKVGIVGLHQCLSASYENLNIEKVFSKYLNFSKRTSPQLADSNPRPLLHSKVETDHSKFTSYSEMHKCWMFSQASEITGWQSTFLIFNMRSRGNTMNAPFHLISGKF